MCANVYWDFRVWLKRESLETEFHMFASEKEKAFFSFSVVDRAGFEPAAS